MSDAIPVVPRHPKGSRARVLLASVFGPYAQDDAYGSRLINPMELYHNQVTRVQRGFSLRTFNRSWGLMLIQANLRAACTLLDFPTEERFVEELRARNYDVIGISSIMTNLLKVRRMCKLVRRHQPGATIVVGGHLANLPDLSRYVDADFMPKSDGVRWMRRFLGEDENAPVRHPVVRANIGSRIMGVELGDFAGDACAALIPSVGCPLGCNFCSTSAMFGGKGRFIEFYRTGEELFSVMSQLEAAAGVGAFFVMDENFLLDKRRALGLLELMERHGKPWSLYVFSSANVLAMYTMDQLVRLGVSWVWMGLEGKDSRYKKLAGTDTVLLVRELQGHGIRVLGSSIIGLEEHTPENIDRAIDHAVGHGTDFHQFMLYTPIPGTPLFEQLDREGKLKTLGEVSIADIHGQYVFNYRHPHIRDGQETEFLLRAFGRDFEVNGPSVVRIIRTVLRGWKRYRNHPDGRVRERFAQEAANLPTHYAGVLWATREEYREQTRLADQISALLEEVHGVCGDRSREMAPVVGRRIYRKLRHQEQLLDGGWTYEPPTFFETNFPGGPEGSVVAASVGPGRQAELAPSTRRRAERVVLS